MAQRQDNVRLIRFLASYQGEPAHIPTLPPEPGRRAPHPPPWEPHCCWRPLCRVPKGNRCIVNHIGRTTTRLGRIHVHSTISGMDLWHSWKPVIRIKEKRRDDLNTWSISIIFSGPLQGRWKGSLIPEGAHMDGYWVVIEWRRNDSAGHRRATRKKKKKGGILVG